MKANRQWAQKWKKITDPINYFEESSSYPQKLANTSWSEWSVLNPPNAAIILNKNPKAPLSHFKITGNRDRFLSYHLPKPQETIRGDANPTCRAKTGAAKSSFRAYPTTSNNEYGWKWDNVSNPEIFKTSKMY
ncbi:hypothetical protein HDU91_005399 [Kappamyces sp. JEL0680]|nr:hypothetical protein HDU91_005399 [Kappamyces sp. JEL0680]